jgi:hypothetical protein
MKTRKQVTSAPDWAAIFERRPDLKPPGYEETVASMKTQSKETYDNLKD